MHRFARALLLACCYGYLLPQQMFWRCPIISMPSPKPTPLPHLLFLEPWEWFHLEPSWPETEEDYDGDSS